MPPKRPTTRSTKRQNDKREQEVEDAEAELMSMEIEISPISLNSKGNSRQKSRKKNAETRQNEVTDMEDLDEMRKLLQDIKVKQQNFEALRNNDLDKNEQSIREFKNNCEKRSQEAMVLQLKRQIENLEHEKRTILSQSQDSMEIVATSSNNSSSNAEVAKLKDLETEKNKRSESEIKHLREQVKNIENSNHAEDVVKLREQVKRLELELKQECENSKKLTAKLSKPSVSRKLNPAELDQKSKEMQEQVSLYAEMSNLLIQNVKVISQDEKTFKCLHSGRNGTLEFKLSFKGGEAHYEPSLQPDRDADLMAILPDYLKEAIDFKKESLDLFFWRILDFLQRSRNDSDGK
ncbi:19760_t:CDS:2 [Cetraspora pellucida]|uniref:19760_t:CDS:1 n=1 Tax=Cetraspora pellucida TaxID=1433469 RepID=A0A9N9DMT4_9GLOM|nr:19760_t:CDS:2 [Cetraspora pellucida]